MVEAGYCHSILLRSDGTALHVGGHVGVYRHIAEPPAGMTYTQVASHAYGSLLLRSDGHVSLHDHLSLPSIPAPPKGLTYKQVATGWTGILLIRSDGAAILRAHRPVPTVPDPPPGTSYVQGALDRHAVLLRDDGVAIARGLNNYGQCNIPQLPSGVIYTQIATGEYHTLLLKSDGTVACCGSNRQAQCHVPELPVGTSYIQVSAGRYHNLFLRSDGYVATSGEKDFGKCDIPECPLNLAYSHVSAGNQHSLVLRSDGHVVAVGCNDDGQCNIPSPQAQDSVLLPGVTYAVPGRVWLCKVLQLVFSAGHTHVTLFSLGLQSVMQLDVDDQETVLAFTKRVYSAEGCRHEVSLEKIQTIEVQLPDGKLLRELDPTAIFAKLYLTAEDDEQTSKKKKLQR